MWFFNVCIISILIAVQGKSVLKDEPDNPVLTWPDTYSAKATKIRVLSGYTEEISIWRTPNKCRLDLNADRKIFINSRYGLLYEIYPRSDENQDVSFTCQKTKGTRHDKVYVDDLINAMPDIDLELQFEDVEMINDKETSRFSYQDKDNGIEFKLWTYLNTVTNATEFIKCEEKNYNTWLGSLTEHYLWYFHEFETEVADEVFDTHEYCKDAVEYDLDVKEDTEHMLYLNPDNVEHEFEAFKKKYNRNYSKEEHTMRKAIFEKNMRLVSETNQKNLGYKLAINQFSDRTDAEMVRRKGLRPRSEGSVGTVPFPYSETELNTIVKTLPKEYDARMYGYVAPVKNQGDCGSCWAFGSTTAMEGALARSSGRLIALADQALVDCSWTYGSDGCDGGYDSSAYKWMMDYGLPTEAEYGPYIDSDGVCNIKNMTKTYPITGFVKVTPNSINAMKVALVYHGPLSVAINTGDGFSSYSSGIYYDFQCSQTALDHIVAIVGYGYKDGVTYWILKNSWGQDWGIDGYMHISAMNNDCGVLTEPAYVII